MACFHFIVLYELDIYAINGKKVQLYAEKVAARYDPHSNPVLGSSPPKHSQKLASMHWEMKGHGSRVNL